MQDPDRDVTVLSIPDRHSTTQYIGLFCEGLEQAGVKVVDATAPNMLRRRFDVLHLHFPVHYIAERSLPYSLARSVFLLLFLAWVKYGGGRTIVYTVHDPIPFRPRAGWLMWPMLSYVHRMVDGYVFLSDESRNDFLTRFPDQAARPSLRTDLCSFPVGMEGSVRLEEHDGRRTRPDVTVGVLGMIKNYKGLQFLEALPRHLSDGTAIRLLVAGEVDPTFKDVADPILERIRDRSTRIDRRLSDDELHGLIRSVDVVFLPYTHGWNSAMAMLVLSCYTPMLSSRQLPFLELERELGAPWVWTFQGPLDGCAGSIEAALDAIRQRDIDAEAVQTLDTFLAARSFGAAGAATRLFYRSLLRSPSPAG